MKLYYSGAQSPDFPQAIPDQSLGGYKSNTVVPQDTPNNIFGELSIYSKQKGSVNTRGIFLTNDESVDIQNLTLYFTYPLDLLGNIKVEIAAVTAVNGNSMEQINSGSGSPYYANFIEANDPLNPVTLVASLPVGESIGLWIRRTIKAMAASSCDTLYDSYKEIVPPLVLSNVNANYAPVAPSNELPNIVKEELLFNFAWD